MENFRDILGLIARREKSGWERLYDEYGSKFYDFAVQRWELSEDEAWEVVYRTLETLVEKVSNYTFQTQEDFDRFIYRVLINYLKKQFRSKKFREAQYTVYVDFNGEYIHSLNNGSLSHQFFQDYYATEEIERPALMHLKSILEGFDPLDKDLLLLRAQNYSYEEIAQLLQIDNNQLKVRHHRAKKRLMDAMSETSKNYIHGKEEN